MTNWRTANRVKGVAERFFQIGLRPILRPFRLEDPAQKGMFRPRHWHRILGVT